MVRNGDALSCAKGATVQVEVLVTLISSTGAALSAVWVGYLSRGRAGRANIGEPLMLMSRRCGRIRGAAMAARKDYEQALERLQDGLPPEWTALQRDSLFEDARADEVLVEEFRFDLDPFNRVVGRLRQWLRSEGEKLDELARSDSFGRGAREGVLAAARQELRLFERLLSDVDTFFLDARDRYLSRQMSKPPQWVVRRLRKRVRKQYDLEAQRAEVDMFGLLPVLSRGQRPPGGPVAAGPGGNDSEPPPCGYCIWRCPHAPTGTGAVGG